MIQIVSPDDPRIFDYRSIGEPSVIERAGLFVAEGRLVVRRLLASGRFRIRSILLTATAWQALATELHDASTPVFVAAQDVMDRTVGFNIHRGCLALAERPALSTIADLPLSALSRVLVLEGVNNPDNVGGLFRSAAAFGVDAIVLGPGSGDPLYRKAIRTSMAATLHIPFAAAGSWPDAVDTLRSQGIRTLALTTVRGARPLDEMPRRLGRIALVVGNEGEGLSEAALAACDERVNIRTTTAVDSLNVTVAASIAMQHFFFRATDRRNA